MPKSFEKYTAIKECLKILLTSCNNEVEHLQNDNTQSHSTINLRLTRGSFDHLSNRSISKNIDLGESYSWEIMKAEIKSIAVKGAKSGIAKSASAGGIVGGVAGAAVGTASLFTGIGIFGQAIAGGILIASGPIGWGIVPVLVGATAVVGLVGGAAVTTAVAGADAVASGISANKANVSNDLTVTKTLKKGMVGYNIVYNSSLATDSDIDIKFSFYKKDLTSTKQEVIKIQNIITTLQKCIQSCDEVDKAIDGFSDTPANAYKCYGMIASKIQIILKNAESIKNPSTGNVNVDKLLSSQITLLIELCKRKVPYFYALCYQMRQENNFNDCFNLDDYDLLIKTAEILQGQSEADVPINSAAAIFVYKKAESLRCDTGLVFKIGELHMNTAEEAADYSMAADYMIKALKLGKTEAMPVLEMLVLRVDTSKGKELLSAINTYKQQQAHGPKITVNFGRFLTDNAPGEEKKTHSRILRPSR